MTTVTDNGLKWYRDLSLNGSETVDKVAVGTGTANESTSDTSLDVQIYESSKSNSDVEINAGSKDNEYVASIQITGGKQVSDGTDITEVGIISSDNVLIARDVFNAVTIKAGVTEAFNITASINR